MSTKADDLAAAIMGQLHGYCDNVTAGVKKAADDVLKMGVQQVAADSPRRTGEYAKGWRGKTVFEDNAGKRNVVYNAKKPQITHLEENGHQNRDGGRTPGKPHIKPAEEMMIREYEKRVEAVIKENGN